LTHDNPAKVAQNNDTKALTEALSCSKETGRCHSRRVRSHPAGTPRSQPKRSVAPDRNPAGDRLGNWERSGESRRGAVQGLGESLPLPSGGSRFSRVGACPRNRSV